MSEQADAREALQSLVDKIFAAEHLDMGRWVEVPLDRWEGIFESASAASDAIAASEPEREPEEAVQMMVAARTPEPAGDSEPADVRGLRERLRKDAQDLSRWRENTPPSYTMGVESLVQDLTEADAALERLEALEAYYRANEDAKANRTGAQRSEPGAFDALTDAQRRRDEARARLATPAPAPQQGGEG